jgi:5,5'-dehydrodivanillate O-demethylase oxygenase subunit
MRSVEKAATKKRSNGHARGVASVNLEYTGPGTLAGRYLRMFWQPIFVASNLLKDRPQPVRVMSQSYTLYRGDSGVPYLVAPVCPHRQTQLSVGWVEGENIRCFYHGWMFDGAGKCVEQPAEPKPFCDKVSIQAYPTREGYGLIFAYLGDGEPPEFPRFPEFEKAEGFLWAESITRHCNFFQNLENAIDTVHTGFVHRTHPGTIDGRRDSPLCFAEEGDWGVVYETKRKSGTYRKTLIGMPNTFNAILLSFEGDSGALWQEALQWYVPIDDESHVAFMARRFLVSNEEARPIIEGIRATVAGRTGNHVELARAILAGKLRLEDIDPASTDFFRLQDDVAQMGQGAITDRSADRLGRSDAGPIMVRKLWMRELKALADGEPLKAWRRPADLVPLNKHT